MRRFGPHRAEAALILAVGLACACGAASPKSDAEASRKVDFAYVLQGQAERLSDLRGRPVVLVLMRTSEVSSQAYMSEVATAFQDTAGEILFLVLTVAANEEPFIELYMESENLPFSVGIAETDVAEGRSSLGIVPAVPTTYLIDKEGVVRDVAVGIVRSDELTTEIRRRFE